MYVLCSLYANVCYFSPMTPPSEDLSMDDADVCIFGGTLTFMRFLYQLQCCYHFYFLLRGEAVEMNSALLYLFLLCFFVKVISICLAYPKTAKVNFLFRV
jgi:hypothetical protein